MYIGGHARGWFPFTTWSFTHLAPHFIKLMCSPLQFLSWQMFETMVSLVPEL